METESKVLTYLPDVWKTVVLVKGFYIADPVSAHFFDLIFVPLSHQDQHKLTSGFFPPSSHGETPYSWSHFMV